MKIVLDGLPIPPSANSTHGINRKTIYNDPKYKNFLDQINKYCLVRAKYLKKIRGPIWEYCQGKNPIRIDTYLCQNKKTIYTKDGRLNNSDADNFIKPLFDGIKKILDIDDRYFLPGPMEHVIFEGEEHFKAVIKKTKIKTMKEGLR